MMGKETKPTAMNQSNTSRGGVQRPWEQSGSSLRPTRWRNSQVGKQAYKRMHKRAFYCGRSRRGGPMQVPWGETGTGKLCPL